MDLNDIPVFLKVVEAGSFSAAARQLNLPKTTVSRRVARLEETIGARLLRRTTRSLSLTDAGRGYYEECRAALTAVEEATRRTAATQEAPSGTIRISAPADTAFISELVAEFLGAHPAVRMEVLLTDTHLNLVREGIDVAFRSGRLPDSSLVARRLAPTRRVFCAAPDYLAAAGRPLVPADLSAHDCIVFGTTVDGNTWMVEGPDGSEAVPVRGRIAVNIMSFAVQATIAGLGIAQLPASLVARDIAAGRLEIVLEDYETSRGGFYAVTPSSRLVPPAVKAFIDFVAERIAAKPRARYPASAPARARS